MGCRGAKKSLTFLFEFPLFLIHFVLWVPSDGAVSKRKQVLADLLAPSGEQRPPSPPGSRPPAPLPVNSQQAESETQPDNQDISPAVAAALLQLISQQDLDAVTSKQSKDSSPAADASGPEEPLPPPWVADSPVKPSTPAEAPAALGTAAAATSAQFPKDQDLRFSHGAAR